MKKDKDTKERKKRRKIFKSKRVDPNVEKIEFRDKIRNCGSPFVVVGKVKEDFTDNTGHMRLWVDMSPSLISGPKVIRSEVIGHITQVYQERIAREIVKLMGNGAFRHRMSEYLDEIAALSLRDDVVITVKRK